MNPLFLAKLILHFSSKSHNLRLLFFSIFFGWFKRSCGMIWVMQFSYETSTLKLCFVYIGTLRHAMAKSSLVRELTDDINLNSGFVFSWRVLRLNLVRTSVLPAGRTDHQPSLVVLMVDLNKNKLHQNFRQQHTLTRNSGITYRDFVLGLKTGFVVEPSLGRGRFTGNLHVEPDVLASLDVQVLQSGTVDLRRSWIKQNH